MLYMKIAVQRLKCNQCCGARAAQLRTLFVGAGAAFLVLRESNVRAETRETNYSKKIAPLFSDLQLQNPVSAKRLTFIFENRF